MDHLILVGQLKSGGAHAVQEERAHSIKELTSWMDWLSKILELTETLGDKSGTVLLGDSQGEHISIPYRLFDESQSILSFDEEPRTEFPME